MFKVILFFTILTHNYCSFCQSNQLDSLNSTLSHLIEQTKSQYKILSTEERKELNAPLLSLDTLKSNIIKKGLVDRSITTVNTQRILIRYKKYVNKIDSTIDPNWINDSIIADNEFIDPYSPMIEVLALITEQQSKISTINNVLADYKPHDSDTIYVTLYYSFIISKKGKAENITLVKTETTGCFKSKLDQSKLANLEQRGYKVLSEMPKWKKNKIPNQNIKLVLPMKLGVIYEDHKK